MNARGIPRTPPQTPSDVALEIQHLIEANETMRILVREACQSLLETVELHLDQTDANLKRVLADVRGR